MNVKEMICTLVGILVAGGVLVSPAACTMNRHRIIAETIAKGADPTAAKCAIESDVGGAPQCVAYTARH